MLGGVTVVVGVEAKAAAVDILIYYFHQEPIVVLGAVGPVFYSVRHLFCRIRREIQSIGMLLFRLSKSIDAFEEQIALYITGNFLLWYETTHSC